MGLGFLILTALLLMLWAELKAIVWMWKDSAEDWRWYRSQNRCRYCCARLDPEYEEIEKMIHGDTEHGH